jgi:hypothetical protein
MAMMRGGVVARVAPVKTGRRNCRSRRSEGRSRVACSKLTSPATGHETEDPGAGLGERHHDRDRVVGGSVGVEGERANGACLSSKLMIPSGFEMSALSAAP